MKAVRLHADGALRYEDAPDPEPAPGEVVVRVRACGVNRLDLDLAEGRATVAMPYPAILGLEIAGEVEGTGERVVVSYARVCGRCRYCAAGRDNLCRERASYGVQRPGGYAEAVAVGRDDLIPIAAGVTFEEAAASQVAFSTALHALRTRAGVVPGDTVLVAGAGGGVGSAAVQVAKHLGARVIASVSSGWKAERARALGADAVELGSGAEEADVVLETSAGPAFAAHLGRLRPGGTLVVVGAHAGASQQVDLGALFRTERRVVGASRATRAEIGEAIALAAGGALRPVVHEAIPLSRTDRAHAMLRDREIFGKIVLVP